MEEESLQSVLKEVETLLRSGHSLAIAEIEPEPAEEMAAFGDGDDMAAAARRCLVRVQLPNGEIRCVKWED